jgi:cation diffusion facilitator CzcD-associated flavoprotein CzcO
MRVAVIGAGPSGLVTLKYLATAHQFLGIEPIEAKLFESEDDVGGTFYARVYEDAEAGQPLFGLKSYNADALVARIFQTTHHLLRLETYRR